MAIQHIQLILESGTPFPHHNKYQLPNHILPPLNRNLN
jgi:hypothetical protein